MRWLDGRDKPHQRGRLTSFSGAERRPPAFPRNPNNSGKSRKGENHVPLFQRYIVVMEHWNTFFGDFRGFSPLRKKDSKGGTAKNSKVIRFRFSGEGTYLDSLPPRRTAFTPPLLEFPYSPSLPKTLGIRLGKGKLLLLWKHSTPPLETLKRLILLRRKGVRKEQTTAFLLLVRIPGRPGIEDFTFLLGDTVL